MFNRARTFLHRCQHASTASPRVPAVALAAAVLATTAHAQGAAAVFRIDDMPGEIHLSDRADASPGVAVRRIAGSSVEGPPGSGLPATRERFGDIVRAAAAAERLPPSLIDAVIAVESAYRVRAVSARGASGLMQLMPATAQLYGVTDIFDPRQNIAAGARHLRSLLDRYGQDVARALAAYNAGAGAIDRAGLHGGAWPGETAAYVPNVLSRHAGQATPRGAATAAP